MPAQLRLRHTQHQHPRRPGKRGLIMPRAVAQREITGLEGGLAATLPIHALTLDLHVHKEQRRTRTRELRAYMVHQLHIGAHLGERQIGDRRPGDGPADRADIHGTRRGWPIGFIGVTGPERRRSAPLEAGRTRILDDRHRELPVSIFGNLVVSWLYGIINCLSQSISLISAICRAWVFRRRIESPVLQRKIWAPSGTPAVRGDPQPALTRCRQGAIGYRWLSSIRRRCASPSPSLASTWARRGRTAHAGAAGMP